MRGLNVVGSGIQYCQLYPALAGNAAMTTTTTTTPGPPDTKQMQSGAYSADPKVGVVSVTLHLLELGDSYTACKVPFPSMGKCRYTADKT